MPFKINETIYNRTALHLVPHGINSRLFYPMLKNSDLKKKRSEFCGGKDYDFVIVYNSRNIQRKRTSNVILAFRTFCDNLPKEQSKKCALILHTELVHEAGTNLAAVKESLCPDYDIIFSQGKIAPENMNLLYNFADVAINISSNEGFGLSTAEAIMAGLPIIVNVTGGLQDQIGQMDDDGNPIKFDLNFGSNNIGKFKNHGVWSKPVWPSASYIQGSPPTPYIFDDICRWEDVAEALMYWYLMPSDKRIECGKKGREWALSDGGINSENMCNQFIKIMDWTLDHWIPVSRFGIYSHKDYVGNLTPNNSPGFEIPTIDKTKLQLEIDQTLEKLNKFERK